MNPTYHAIFILAVPFVAAALIALFFRKKGNVAAGISLTAAAVILISSLALVWGGERFSTGWEWLTLGDYTLWLGIYFNDLAALMLFVVAFVGFLIHVFSLKYMKDDPGKARFFGGLSLFMFSMTGMVLADNLMVIFIFWELVGLSSFLLINHWFHLPAAVAASKKAFIVNRVGDFGFLIGIIWTYWQFGTLNLVELAEIAAFSPEILLIGVGLLLFCGALGKSGQLPLHVWLPDAMEGPTPVSALIHAATMVAAGIYLLCRVYFMMLPEVLTVILIVGTATAVFGAFTAIVQTDIKKILAYSTISQLGFMVAAFGLGALPETAGSAAGGEQVVTAGGAAAMFHLTTHAFFKALLFLGAGSIIYACHHQQNIYKMGGLARKMPWTFAFFTIAFLALIGFPGLSGFFSKDAILYLAWINNPVIFWILGFTSLLTAFYMTRLWLTVFFGEPKSDEAGHAHEGGSLMVVPLAVLAVGSVVAGWTFLHPPAFAGVIDQIPHPEGAAHYLVLIVSIVVVVVGFGVAWLLYRPGAAEDRLEQRAPCLHHFLGQKLYFDAVYGWYVAKVQQRGATLLSFLDQILIGGVLVRGAAGFVALFGVGAKAGYTGNLHSYVYWFFIGTVLLTVLAIGLF
jgi:NADH-quinone oxidoreductase subunit L